MLTYSHIPYIKLPVISPGLIHLRTEVLGGRINGGAFIQGGLQLGKKRFETNFSSSDQNPFCIYWF